MLNEEQLNFYKDKGYIILDDVISMLDLKYIKDSLNAVLDAIADRAKLEYPSYLEKFESTDNISKKMNFLEELDHKFIAEFHDSMQTANNPYVAKLISSEKILNYVNFLLGETPHNPLFMTSSMGIFSMPNNIEHTVNQWHTDTFYTCKDGHYVHVWAPIIEDSSEDIGSLRILPGSHKEPFKGEMRDSSNQISDIHKFVISKKFVEKYDEIVITAKKGQVVFFNQYLVHRGGLNISDRTRFGLVTLYHSMSNLKFTPYYLQHPKSLLTSDDFFDEVMLKKTHNDKN
jgi:ectoine hydroxylase-related dioxygenase (phytanoyl-CoA dioxygenase family)